ncbi:MAG: sulfite exporter TauE/SafE family protein [Deltaproteobacteria bacterium]|nr:sulfite exporter TauE/SafE family protein [Deltaproteobacteria bacterium]
MTAAMLEGLMLGVGSGGACLAECMPFLLPYLLMGAERGHAGSFRLFAQFMAGRLVAYLLFGLLAGSAGRSLQGLITPAIAGGLLMAAAAVLLVAGAAAGRPQLGFCRFVQKKGIAGHMPFVTGFVLGINICPPFAAALLRVIQLQGIATGLGYFGMLFLGSSLYMLPLPALSGFVRSTLFQRLGRNLSLLVGGWFMLQGVMYLWS